LPIEPQSPIARSIASQQQPPPPPPQQQQQQAQHPIDILIPSWKRSTAVWWELWAGLEFVLFDFIIVVVIIVIIIYCRCFIHDWPGIVLFDFSHCRCFIDRLVWNCPF
jgi:hypothetical protein